MPLEIHSKKVLDSVREGKKQGSPTTGSRGGWSREGGPGTGMLCDEESLVHMVWKESQSGEHRV